MGQISPEPRLSEARITAIRMIVGRITDSASPSIETSSVSFPRRANVTGFGAWEVTLLSRLFVLVAVLLRSSQDLLRERVSTCRRRQLKRPADRWRKSTRSAGRHLRMVETFETCLTDRKNVLLFAPWRLPGMSEPARCFRPLRRTI